jgi:protein involved in polysaccharide export with SLBB domain
MPDSSSKRILLAALLVAMSVLTVARAEPPEIRRPDPEVEKIKPLPVPEIPDNPPPHEGAMVDFPIIIDSPDLIIVEVLEALPGRPISGERLVRPDGTVNLGFYGEVHVRGLTLLQAKEKIIRHLRPILNDEILGLSIIGVEPADDLPKVNAPLPENPGQKDVGKTSGAPGPRARPGAKSASSFQVRRASQPEKARPRPLTAPMPESGERPIAPPISPSPELENRLTIPLGDGVKITVEIRRETARLPIFPPEEFGMPGRVLPPLPPLPPGEFDVPGPPLPQALRGAPAPASPPVEAGEPDRAVSPPPTPPDDGKPIAVHPVDSNRVFVDMSAYNSKNYFVQGDVASPGRLPWTGKETVLDVINYAGGLLVTGDPKDIRLVRPGRGGKPARVYKIDLEAITERGEKELNYQIFPGDRLVVGRNSVVKTTLEVDRVAAPLQTVYHSILQESYAIRSLLQAASGGNEVLTSEQREAVVRESFEFWRKIVSRPEGAPLDEKTFREALNRAFNPPSVEKRGEPKK